VVKYEIVDVILSQVLGREYVLDPDWNYAEDTPFGIKVRAEAVSLFDL